MGKPTICIDNKSADQLRCNCEADQRLCFRYTKAQSLLYLTTKFHASSLLLCLYRPVCVRPVLKPHGWFSHKAAQILMILSLFTQKSTGSAKLSSVFPERFSDEGQADFAVNKAF